MEVRFKVIDTNVIDEQGRPTGQKKYRIFDKEDPSDLSKNGVFSDKPEADSVCAKLNAENAR